MPPARKAAARTQHEGSLDPALQPSTNDDVPSNEAGPSKRAKPTSKTKTTKMSAERKEANRLAAERSRVRRAERASILEQTAKGLAEENLVLKERIRKLVAMGVGADAGGDHSMADGSTDRSHTMAPSQSRQSQEPSRAVTNTLPAPAISSGHDIVNNPPTQSHSSPALRRQASTPLLEGQRSDYNMPSNDTPKMNNTSSLHQEMVAYFRQQVDQLGHLLHEKRGQLGSDDASQDVTMSDQTTEVDLSSQSDVQQHNDRLLREVQVLHEVVLRVKADRTKAKAANDRLKAQVKAAEAQLLVRDNFARTEDEAVAEIEERRSETQKAFKDVKRHLGLLIGHFNPTFVEPDLPEQEAFMVPAPYESAPLPEPQKRGRPPLTKSRASSQPKSQRKISAAESMLSSNQRDSHYESGPTLSIAQSSTLTPPLLAMKSNRSKKRYEPSKVRYRLDADPDVIYIEEREIIQNEHGEQEIVHISKQPVYNPRPGSGAGRKPAMSRGQDVTPGTQEHGTQEMHAEQDRVAFDEQTMEHHDMIVDPSLNRSDVVMDHQTLHEAENMP
ncbi:hypothetical protein QFC22_005561 [Naganishia vaughanmartiniae]|uniref:Uncharacterized protein n=1 Tax=Naganishia vaughanmartiniae TaxID=1424756 RepID=A0ACC2WSE8_9TREE|nr:hypothetical protein QFC22_005561 [Naganishia vaughanmartiniae]